MGRDSFLAHIKIDDIYTGIAEDLETFILRIMS